MLRRSGVALGAVAGRMRNHFQPGWRSTGTDNGASVTKTVFEDDQEHSHIRTIEATWELDPAEWFMSGSGNSATHARRPPILRSGRPAPGIRGRSRCIHHRDDAGRWLENGAHGRSPTLPPPLPSRVPSPSTCNGDTRLAVRALLRPLARSCRDSSGAAGQTPRVRPVTANRAR